jgi:hypothetical protein
MYSNVLSFFLSRIIGFSQSRVVNALLAQTVHSPVNIVRYRAP